MRSAICAHLALSLLTCASLYTEEGSPSVRPDDLNNIQATTAWLIPTDVWEAELVASYFDYGAVNVSEIRAELAKAFSERFMMEVEIPFVHIDTPTGNEAGLGDIDIEVKGAITTLRAIDISAMIECELPTGDDKKGLGSGHVEIEAWGLASHTYQEINTSAHLGLGTEWEEGEGIERLLISAALDNTSLSEELALQLGVRSSFGEGDSPISLVGGIRTEVEGADMELEAALGLSLGLNDDAEDWGLTLVGELEF